MSETTKSKKYALESLRLAADCKWLARKATTLGLQKHIVRIAGMWMEHAD
jgi:hypothetical protein